MHHETGANAPLVIASLVACLIMFVLLMVYVVANAPSAAWVTLLATLAAAFVIEVVYRRRTGRRFKQLDEHPAATP